MHITLTTRLETPQLTVDPSVGHKSIMKTPCTSIAAFPVKRKATASRRASRGFTLVELMIVVSVIGVLSSVAYPAFTDQVQRVRRTDAVIAMMQVQLAQERWRSNSTAYGSLTQIGVAARSIAGHYTLQLSNNTANGYEVVASAAGSQARDTTCAHLKLDMQGANPVYTSGPDASTTNPIDTNRRCWSL